MHEARYRPTSELPAGVRTSLPSYQLMRTTCPATTLSPAVIARTLAYSSTLGVHKLQLIRRSQKSIDNAANSKTGAKGKAAAVPVVCVTR